MSRIWRIKKCNGDKPPDEWSVSSALSEPEICTMLQRLVSTNLSDSEVIDASLRRDDPKYRPLLERIGTGNPINFGHGIHYTAELKDD